MDLKRTLLVIHNNSIGGVTLYLHVSVGIFLLEIMSSEASKCTPFGIKECEDMTTDCLSNLSPLIP